ncbi:MAG: hypothetical protein HC904_07420 [Blastochloris sp.]|nr:hypothetical protein [Blastochloris sp.]
MKFPWPGLVTYAESLNQSASLGAGYALSFDPFIYSRRNSAPLNVQGFQLGGTEPARVFSTADLHETLKPRFAQMGDTAPEIVYETSGVQEVDLQTKGKSRPSMTWRAPWSSQSRTAQH